MRIVNMYEAKGRLSELTAAAVAGEEIVIAKNGTPLVRLVPVTKIRRSAAFGMDRDLVTMAPDFDDPLADFSDYA